MFVFGGIDCSYIESLNVGVDIYWQVIAQSSLVNLFAPAIAILNDHQIACFGHMSYDDSFILDVQDYSIKKIPGAGRDLGRYCKS